MRFSPPYLALVVIVTPETSFSVVLLFKPNFSFKQNIYSVKAIGLFSIFALQTRKECKIFLDSHKGLLLSYKKSQTLVKQYFSQKTLMSNLSLFCVLNTKGFQVKAIVGTYQLRVSNKENKFCLKKILKLLQIHGVSKEQWSKARFILYGGMETPMKNK